MSRPLTHEERTEITRRHIDFSLRQTGDGSWEVLESGVVVLPIYEHRVDAVIALLHCYRAALREPGIRRMVHPRNAERIARALRRGIESARKSRDDADGSEHD